MCDIEIEQYAYLPCSLKEFKINGIDASYEDFGYTECERIKPYTCTNFHFVSRFSTPEVLNHYNITESEYDQICEKLEMIFDFGECGLCI